MKRLINKIFNRIFKWIDVKRSFGCYVDQRRFTQFVIENKSSLFEVVSSSSLDCVDNTELKKLIES